jgi:alpha-1,2-mannosyltransferase
LEIIGILVCALTGLLVSPVSWSHHWVWVAPMLMVLAYLATGPVALPRPRLWRLVCWAGFAATCALFSGVLWVLRSAGTKPPVQGKVMTGGEQVIGDLYVLAGVLGLGVVACALVLSYRRDKSAVTAPRRPRADEQIPI